MAGLFPYRLQQGVVATACIAVCAIFSGPASAALIIRYGGNSITQGGTGILDVLISSDAAGGTPDLLDSFSGHFQIAPVGGAVSNGVQFATVQAESQLGNPAYVFSGDSLGEGGGIPLGSVLTLVNNNDTYIAGDGTVSGSGMPLSISSGTFLLFRLNLDATLANLGDQFTVSLINDGFTAFQNPVFANLSLDTSSFDANTMTAVPEPSSGIMLLLAALGVGIYRLRRRAQFPEKSEALWISPHAQSATVLLRVKVVTSQP